MQITSVGMGLIVDDIHPQTVVPSQSNHILTMPVQQFVSQIKVRSRSKRVCFPDLTTSQDASGVDRRC